MQPVFRCALGALVVLLSSTAAAQTSGAAGSSGSSGASQASQVPVRVPGSSVTVTAQKEPADPATLPVSVSTVQEDLIKASGITFVSDAGIFSPNTARATPGFSTMARSIPPAVRQARPQYDAGHDHRG